MTKTNAKKKMEKLGTVTLDGNGPDFRVALDLHDLICICNPGPDGDVITFVAERCADGFQTFLVAATARVCQDPYPQTTPIRIASRNGIRT